MSVHFPGHRPTTHLAQFARDGSRPPCLDRPLGGIKPQGQSFRCLFLQTAQATCLGLIVDLLLDACDHAARWGSRPLVQLGFKRSPLKGLKSPRRAQDMLAEKPRGPQGTNWPVRRPVTAPGPPVKKTSGSSGPLQGKPSSQSAHGTTLHISQHPVVNS